MAVQCMSSSWAQLEQTPQRRVNTVSDGLENMFLLWPFLILVDMQIMSSHLATWNEPISQSIISQAEHRL